MSSDSERIFAYYETPWTTAEVWQEFVSFFVGEIEVLKVAMSQENGQKVKALVAISQEGLAKGRTEWEKMKTSHGES